MTMTRFICIGGKAQHGKDTSASMLKHELEATGKRVLLTHYADLLKFMCRNYFGWNGEKDEAGRTLLQRVGTEQVRSKQPNFWVDFLLSVVSVFPDEWDYIIIADVRFPNEITCIQQRGYPTTYVKVVRPNFDNQLTEEQQQHKSETALDDFIPNVVVVNNGTLDDLKNTIRGLCHDILGRSTEQ